jgi:hypothetical protein
MASSALNGRAAFGYILFRTVQSLALREEHRLGEESK